MVFDLTEVFASQGASKQVSYDLDMSHTEFSGGYPFTSPVSVMAYAQNIAGMVSVDIDTSFDFETRCDRCFEKIKSRMEYHFTHRLIEALQEEYNDDYIETPDMSLELDDLVSSDILLELPSKFLCRGDCQGLCQKCGHNLNLGDCGCDRDEIDPRLASLKNLLD